MDFFRKTRVIATILKPAGTGVILHCGELGVFVFEPNFHLLYFAELLFGEENADALKVVGEHLEGFLSFFSMLSVFKKRRVNVHGPAFDVLLYGLYPADSLRPRVLLFITKGEPGG